MMPGYWEYWEYWERAGKEKFLHKVISLRTQAQKTVLPVLLVLPVSQPILGVPMINLTSL